MKRILIYSLVWGTLLAMTGSARPRPESHFNCTELDLNHDGVVNVQDLQIAVNRHDRRLYEEITRAILAKACEVR